MDEEVIEAITEPVDRRGNLSHGALAQILSRNVLPVFGQFLLHNGCLGRGVRGHYLGRRVSSGLCLG
jgi:hypothetical protein